MKKSLLTFAAIALVLSFTSCKEVSAETTTETEAEVIETTPAPAEVLETPAEEVVDSTSSDSLVEEPVTTPNE